LTDTDELVRRVAKLEAELAEAKKALEAVKPKEPFKPKFEMPRFDPTEGFRLPASAAREMARVVPDVKAEPMTAEQVQSSWARSRISGPGGFGPPKWEKEKRQPVPVKKAEEEKVKDTRSPQTKMFDAMVAHMVGGPNEPVK
jgi:hypothetical protein